MATWNASHDALVTELEQLSSQVYQTTTTTQSVVSGYTISGQHYDYGTGTWFPDYSPIYSSIPTSETTPSPAILARIEEIQAELASVEPPPNQQTKLAELMAEFETAREQATAANEQRYQQMLGFQTDAEGNLIQGTMPSDYQQRMDQVMSTYYNPLYTQAGLGGSNPTLASQLQSGQSNLAQGWSDLTSKIDTAINDIGASGRQSIQDVYAQQRAGSEQDMINRGMGNTTVNSAAKAQLAALESRDLAAMNEQLAQLRLGAYQSSGMGALQSQEGQLANSLSLGLQGLGYQAQAGNMYAQLSGDPLGVMERRTDTSPSLADIWNAALTMGQGEASQDLLHSLTPQNMYQSQNPFGVTPYQPVAFNA
jgi:hypothetical protein